MQKLQFAVTNQNAFRYKFIGVREWLFLGMQKIFAQI